MKFRSDYGVFVCPHVFKNERPILEVIRDPDGYWQFLCGSKHDPKKEPFHHIEVGDLIERDPNIAGTVKLEIATYAERKELGKKWRYGKLKV